jgi:acyl-CoA-binding protein
MLFDLRGRGRRRTIQGIYLMLAVLMGAGLVLFGIGGSVSGGLLDAFNGNGGSVSTSGFDKQIKTAQRRVRLDPQNPAGWAALTRAQYQQASLGDNYDQATGTFTTKGKAQLARAAQSWDRYVALNPKSFDDGLARLMVQGFGTSGLNQPGKAAEAAEIITESAPSAASFSQLALYAYKAGQTRKGDLASQKAVELTPKADRKLMKQRLDQVKTQAASGSQGASGATPTG